MLALSIRQPYAELILRGIKTVEYRSKPTRMVGRRFYIYASKGTGNSGQGTGKAWSKDLAMAEPGGLPEWMVELAEQIKLIPPGLELPRGVIVGSAVIEKCEEVERVVSGQLPVASGEKVVSGQLPVAREDQETSSSLLATNNWQLATMYRWHLAEVQRAKKLRKPRGHPQPVWFEPFN